MDVLWTPCAAILNGHCTFCVSRSQVKRKLKTEEARLSTLFRVPVSPRSRCVVARDGRRYRPGLYDLRRVDEVGDLLSRAEKQPQ